MSVLPEIRIEALKKAMEMEEISVWNLAQARRFDFSIFDSKDKKEIFELLDQLREDTAKHQKSLLKIIEDLKIFHKPSSTPNMILKEFENILALEEKAGEAYQQIALDCDDGKIREQLEQIAAEEMNHVKIARRLVGLARRLVEVRNKNLRKNR